MSSCFLLKLLNVLIGANDTERLLEALVLPDPSRLAEEQIVVMELALAPSPLHASITFTTSLTTSAELLGAMAVAYPPSEETDPVFIWLIRVPGDWADPVVQKVLSSEQFF